MPSENIVSFYFIRSYGPFKLWHNLCEANKKLEIYRPQFDAKSSTKAETLPHAKHHEPALHCFFPFFFFFFFAFFFSRIHLIPFDTFSTISLKSDSYLIFVTSISSGASVKSFDWGELFHNERERDSCVMFYSAVCFFAHSMWFYTECVILHTVSNFTHDV